MVKPGLVAADEFVEAGKIAVDAIAPHADLLGLSEGDSSFVNQPANKRIEMAVATLDKLIPELDNVVVAFGKRQRLRLIK